MADTTTELEVLDQIVDVLGGQSGQYETVVPTLQQIRDLLGGGGGRGGYNPSLSVGRADALTGADSTAQWAQRTSEGSGAATVRNVQGAAVAWNQLVNGVDRNSTAYGLTMVYANGKATLSGVAEATNNFWLTDTNIPIVNGHKYLTIGGNTAAHVYINMDGIGSVFDPSIVTATQTTTTRALLCFTDAADLTTPYECYPQLFDLTVMFGAGNEPQSVAEFEGMYPESYYPYSAPTLKPVQISGIRSTDAQGGELDSVEWDISAYFPDGMWAAGPHKDVLYPDRAEIVVRSVLINGVNGEGTKAVTSSSSSGGKLHALVNIGAGYLAYSGFSTVECVSDNPDIPALTAGTEYDGTTGVCVANAQYIRFNCADIQDMSVAQMNEWVTQHPFRVYYALATPTTQPISPALDMTYRVQAGGSESIIVPAGEISAAPVLTVAEGESAADVVMDALACIAAPDGPTATANHAINTYLTMQGKLYKVTSAIAVGETITPNTNVTQTTVMAELIARTA